MKDGITIEPDMEKMRSLPVPQRDALPPAWSDMNLTERQFFIYRWRIDNGYLPRTDDWEQALLDAGFSVTRYPPRH